MYTVGYAVRERKKKSRWATVLKVRELSQIEIQRDTGNYMKRRKYAQWGTEGKVVS